MNSLTSDEDNVVCPSIHVQKGRRGDDTTIIGSEQFFGNSLTLKYFPFFLQVSEFIQHILILIKTFLYEINRRYVKNIKFLTIEWYV